MNYYLLGKKGEVEKVILSSPRKKLLMDLTEVLVKRGVEMEFRILEGIEFKSLIRNQEKSYPK